MPDSRQKEDGVSVRQQEGAGWMIDFTFRYPDGRKERVREVSPVQTRRGAEEYERQRRQALLDGSAAKEEAKRQEPTMAEFADKFLAYSDTNNKRSTAYAKRWILEKHLKPAFGQKRLGEITAPEIEAYKAAKLKEGQSPKSVNNHLAALRKLLNLAVEWGELAAAPKLKALRLEEQEFEFLTFEETPRFLAAVAPEWSAMATVAVKTGLRLGELLALKWRDVDLKAGRIVVRATRWGGEDNSPKGGRKREVDLGDKAIAAFKGHKHLRGPYVFCHDDGTPLTHAEVKRVVPAACQRAGLAKRLTWHDLRHTYASQMVMRGAPLKTVQELLGHATIEMTMRYAHLSPDTRREAVRLLDEECAPAWQANGKTNPATKKAPENPGLS